MLEACRDASIQLSVYRWPFQRFGAGLSRAAVLQNTADSHLPFRTARAALSRACREHVASFRVLSGPWDAFLTRPRDSARATFPTRAGHAGRQRACAAVPWMGRAQLQLGLTSDAVVGCGSLCRRSYCDGWCRAQFPPAGATTFRAVALPLLRGVPALASLGRRA